MGLAFPNPQKRDRRSREAYARLHPHCEIVGCGRPGEPVRLIPAERGGGDDHANLITCCYDHGEGSKGIETLGPEEWFARCAASLEPATLARVQRVLGLEE